MLTNDLALLLQNDPSDFYSLTQPLRPRDWVSRRRINRAFNKAEPSTWTDSEQCLLQFLLVHEIYRLLDSHNLHLEQQFSLQDLLALESPPDSPVASRFMAGPSSVIPPQPAMMLPREIIHDALPLPHKPGADVHYSLARGNDKRFVSTPPVIVVFLNGLMTDKSSWLPVMAGIIRQRKGTSTSWPTLLAYDRYGQGLTTDRDPEDWGREEGHGHDVADAATDLRQLIAQVCREEGQEPQVVLVANSIGCAIARLYAQQWPVAALLFLDSIMANSDFDLWPDPDGPDFDVGMVPEDVSLDELRSQRRKFAEVFSPNVVNWEGLDRRNLRELLPESDGPMLGTAGARPWVTVVGHDFQRFAEESLKSMGTPMSLSMQYSNPIWRQYNRGLAKLTEPNFSKGPFQAPGCGHFIQRDDPNLVVDETLDLVDKVMLKSSAMW